MDLQGIILNLKTERNTLAAAIECLERLAAGRAKKRGRPPAWLKATRQGGEAAENLARHSDQAGSSSEECGSR